MLDKLMGDEAEMLGLNATSPAAAAAATHCPRPPNFIRRSVMPLERKSVGRKFVRMSSSGSFCMSDAEKAIAQVEMLLEAYHLRISHVLVELQVGGWVGGWVAWLPPQSLTGS